MFALLLAEGGLSLDRLASFCAVAEAGGVTRAAGGDPVRQSLFSRQIKELEAYFGTELIRRHGRGIALTTAGRKLHRLAREQFLALGDFRDACASRPVTLSLAAGDSVLQWGVLPRLPEIRAALPNVRWRLLNLTSAAIIDRLREGTADVGIVRAEMVPAGLRNQSLPPWDFGWFVPRELWSSPRPSRPTLANLACLPGAILEGEGRFRRELDRLLASHKTALNVQIELSSFAQVARAVETGAFAGILPTVAAGTLISQRRDAAATVATLPAGTDSTRSCDEDGDAVERVATREPRRAGNVRRGNRSGRAVPALGRAGVDCFQPAALRELRRELVLVWSPRTASVRPAIDQAVPLLAAAFDPRKATPRSSGGR